MTTKRPRTTRPPAPDGHSVCFGTRGCGATLTLEHFRVVAGKPYALCRPCDRADTAASAAGNRNPARSRATFLSWRYGISVEDVDTLATAQGGRCALCRRLELDCQPIMRKGVNAASRLVVEHDHSTGKVRGLVCQPCNGILGHLESLPREVRGYVASSRALAYLADPPAARLGVGQRGHHTQRLQQMDTA